MDKLICRKSVRSHPLSKPEPTVKTVVAVHNFIFTVHNTLVGDIFLHKAHLLGHSEIAFFEQPYIAEMSVHLPRHYVHSGSPAYSSAASRLPWCGIRNVTCLDILSIPHVTQPFVIEGVTVVICHDGLAADLTVTRIWRLFTMRTVAHHTSVKIILKTPSPYRIYLIQKRIGCRKLRISLDIRIYHFCHDILPTELHSCNYCLSEYIPCELRSVVPTLTVSEDIFLCAHW